MSPTHCDALWARLPQVGSNTALMSLSATMLEFVSGQFQVGPGNPALTMLSLPALESVGGGYVTGVGCFQCPAASECIPMEESSLQHGIGEFPTPTAAAGPKPRRQALVLLLSRARGFRRQGGHPAVHAQSEARLHDFRPCCSRSGATHACGANVRCRSLCGWLDSTLKSAPAQAQEQA